MIRFGADAVFNSKGGELEEEDIDAIIARGEERTEQDNAKLQDQSNSLANFTLNGEERSLYEFGGQDWSGGADGALAINLPKRVEKKNYNEADMAHQRQERAPKMPRHLQVMPRPPPHRLRLHYHRHLLHRLLLHHLLRLTASASRPLQPGAYDIDFQFFEHGRLEALQEKERHVTRTQQMRAAPHHPVPPSSPRPALIPLRSVRGGCGRTRSAGRRPTRATTAARAAPPTRGTTTGCPSRRS